MKGLQRIGEYIWEFLVVTVITAVAAATVLPFFAVVVGLTDYFSKSVDDRRFKDIFIAIGQNIKLICLYTLFELVILIVPVFNIYFFNTHPENLNAFVLGVSYVALVFGIIYAVTAPTIIINMEVTFLQLLRNGFMLIFGGLIRAIVSVACVVGIVLLIMYYPYALVLTPYPIAYLITLLMKENFYKLKAKVLGTTVEQLKKQENTDDYLDEYGRINRPAMGQSEVGENEDDEQKD
ncbi:MAG: hypothetical protein ACI4MQ_00380 [Candidatus Coproplasma sp.]